MEISKLITVMEHSADIYCISNNPDLFTIEKIQTNNTILFLDEYSNWNVKSTKTNNVYRLKDTFNLSDFRDTFTDLINLFI